MARDDEEYFGDGLYARYNGQEIWLRAGDSEVCLDTGMLKKLQSMVDNYEPPERDGERFRGREAAAYHAEQQGRIQRELKR